MRQVLILFFLLTGCAGRRESTIYLEIDPPRVHETVDGKSRITVVENHISVRDLDAAVREYVNNNAIDFDFHGTSGRYNVARDRNYLASGYYGSRFGDPVLSVEIGWDGNVKSHHIGIAVCGTCLELVQDADLGLEAETE